MALLVYPHHPWDLITIWQPPTGLQNSLHHPPQKQNALPSQTPIFFFWNSPIWKHNYFLSQNTVYISYMCLKQSLHLYMYY